MVSQVPEANKDSHDGLGVFGEEVLRAARSLSSLEWRVIREERFHVTPVGARQTSTVACYLRARRMCSICRISCLLSCPADSEPSRCRLDRYVRRDRENAECVLRRSAGEEKTRRKTT